MENQPGATLEVGSVGVHVALSDVAILVVAVVAAVTVWRRGAASLRAARTVWLAAGAFLALVFAATLYGKAVDGGYALGEHAVTAAKFAEYSLLALAVPVLVRGRRDIEALLGVVSLWSALATLLALAQFLGADVAGAWSAGRRQPSFLGHHDFAALSGAALAVGLGALALGRDWPVRRAISATAGAAGGLGLVLSGSVAGVMGAAAAALAVAAVALRRRTSSPRRLLAVAAAIAAVGAGVVALRSQDFDQFLRWLGVRTEQRTTREDVQTYAHHTLLAYIGWRIFRDHPLLGVGWQGSAEYANYRPYLDDARRRFPNTAPRAFPGRDRPYGVQNVWVQALADLGAVGFALFVGLFATGLAFAGRLALRAPPATAAVAALGGAWLLVTMGVWSANGLVAGIPIDALLWLALGLVGASAAMARDARA